MLDTLPEPTQASAKPILLRGKEIKEAKAEGQKSRGADETGRNWASGWKALPVHPPKAPKYARADAPRFENGRLICPDSASATTQSQIAGRRSQTALNQQPATSRLAGVVLDYTTINTSQTNYTFKGDVTYLVSAAVNLSGTTTFEAGSVLKFAATNSPQLSIVSTGTVVWQGTSYRPVVLTARDDQSVGEVITPTNALSGYYAVVALNLAGTNAVTIQNVRIVRAQTGIGFSGGTGHVIRHGQFVDCQNVLGTASGSDVSLRNALVTNALKVVNASGASTVRGEHWTVNVASNLYSGSATLNLTNCLLVAVTNVGAYSNTGGVSLSSGSGVFQGVGAGWHYLASNSPYRNYAQASTNINSTLLGELRKLTTYPPIELTTDFTSDTTLFSQAQRDTDSLDLGYHADPLDYVWTTRNLTNATLLLTNGVAVGVYGSKGTTLRNGAKFVSQGAPNNLNRLVRYTAVQEQPMVWGGSASSLLDYYSGSSPVPQVWLTFTDVSLLAASQRVLVDGLNATYNPINPLAIAHSQLRGVAQTIQIFSTGAVVALTNNVHERCTWYWGQGYTGYYTFSPYTLTLYNNLFSLGSVTFYYATNTTTWTVKDNLFTPDSLTKQGSYSLTAGYNGYRSGLTSLGGSGNVTVTNLDFQIGPLGNYYYPTNGTDLVRLLDAGSRAATNAGLYHFTTTTNQVKEGSSQVDIGYHYVAVDLLTGLPLDYDGDGLPDYFEDRNGNGQPDTGETNWQVSENGTTGVPGLQVFTPLK